MAEWVTAIGTIGTFLVIAASAAAALVQLRHMRASNQIAALTEFRETMESPQFQEAQHFVSYELAQRLKDPEGRIQATTLPFTGDYRAIAQVANMFETLGNFVRNGVIDSDIACSVVSYIVLRNWDALLPLTTFVRKKLDEPALWENFEYLALISQRYNRARPGGDYPPNLPRMPEDNSLLEMPPAP